MPRVPRSWLCVLLAGASCAAVACASPQPDVVAQKLKRDVAPADSGFGPPVPKGICEAGRYSGTFNTERGDSGPPSLNLEGRMEFRLVKSSQTGEIATLENAFPLSIHSNIGLDFNATVSGGEACRQGEFKVGLAGVYDTDASLPASLSFEGPITGRYVPASDAGMPAFFAGQWQVYVTTGEQHPTQDQQHPTPFAYGVWSAVYAGP